MGRVLEKKKLEQESNNQAKKTSQIEQQMLNIVLIYSGPAVLMAM